MSVLPSIQMGWNALRFDSDDTSSSLTMKSEGLVEGLRIDLPKLTTITTATGDDGSLTDSYPSHVVLESM